MKRLNIIRAALGTILVILLAGIGITLPGSDHSIAQGNETPTWIPAGTHNTDWTPITQEINGIPVVYVPTGCFTMGSGRYNNQFHEVCLDAFWIGQTEVTYTQYQDCVDAGVCRDYTPTHYDESVSGNLPIGNITWLGARLYAKWLGGSLPTEAQWEYAARGPESWVYPWGNQFDGTRLNYCDARCVEKTRDATYTGIGSRPFPVGSFPGGASWVGALDMSGNVAEWVADLYGTYKIGRQVNPTGPQIGEKYVVRGGYYYAREMNFTRSDERFSAVPDYRSGWYGFRVAFPAGLPAPTSEPPVVIRETVMLDVPAGCFMMGSQGPSGSSPLHEVCLNAYKIGQTEVTNAQFQRCVEAGVCEAPDSATYGDPAYANYPVVGITWISATAYAAWSGGGLLTEAQWEYAARGPESLLYPWGNEFDGTRLNYCDINCDSRLSDTTHDDGYWHTSPVGTYPAGASWIGALDMAGNAWELTNDWWGSYPAEGQIDPTGPVDGDRHVTRGGAWHDTESKTQSSVRATWITCEWKDCASLGFRIVMPADPAPSAVVFLTPVPVPTAHPPFAAGENNTGWTPVLQSKNGLSVVSVPDGCFMMGSANGEGDETPIHETCMDGYWIGQTEVTNAQYRACVDAGVCTPPDDRTWFDDPAYAGYPVLYVTWDDAAAYAAWVNGSLPTEAQWEYAARGPEAWTYPWGNEFDGTRLNFCDTNCGQDWHSSDYNDGFAQVSPAGSLTSGASWVGALDMAGNVWEWVADWYENYPAESQTNPTGPASGDQRVVRGGSWAESAYTVRTTYRDYNSPGSDSSVIGFRVVIPSDPALQVTPTPAFVLPTIAAPTPTATPTAPAYVIQAGTSNADWTPETQEFNRIAMAHVPGGCFMMGSSESQIEAAFQQCESVRGKGQCNRTLFENQGPAHEVCLSEYWISQTEISNAQYKACVDAGVCYLPGYPSSRYQSSTWGDPAIDDYPATVTWEQAVIYTQWIGSSLPTEAQWEYAARGPEGLTYPWGNQYDGLRLNYCDRSCNGNERDHNYEDGYRLLAPVSSFENGVSWVGALNMLGNVSEWTADHYGSYGVGRQLDPTGPTAGDARVVRGGAWDTNWVYIQTAARSARSENKLTNLYGFRVVVTQSEP
jgi:formylglycine-generating enzyme required for sulfatase activity